MIIEYIAKITDMKLLFTCEIAGAIHYDELAVRDLAPGTVLSLIPEPDNKFDPLAVRVEWNGIKLGYIPNRSGNHEAELLPNYTNVVCIVQEVRSVFEHIRSRVVLGVYY